ncbi:MAG TPA: MHYT domain-containing protein [Candidatus Acidoferrales bacterium]|nr:MHYT domain-containing protein [Candidatus Acidoferrales bacterium]
MNQTGAPLVGSYDYGEVARSILIAFAASYAALDLAGRITAARGWVRAAWLTGGAIAMGIGIWSMNFKALLAFRLPVKVEYHWPTVLASLVIAVLASEIALHIASREKMGPAQAWVGSVIMGGGIAAVHYLGIAAMRLAATTRFEPLLVTLSVVIAILFSRLALAFTFDRREDPAGAPLAKVISAAVMGAAITLMHYSGMAAVSFLPTAVMPNLSHTVIIFPLGGYGIVIVTFLVLGTAILTSSVDRQTQAEALRLNEGLEQRVIERTRRLSNANQELRRLSGQLLRSQDEERRRIARDLHDDLGQDLFAANLALGQLSRIISEGRHRESLSEAQEMVRTCAEKVRTIAHLLHPPELELLGLRTTLIAYVDGFRERSGIQVDVEIPRELPKLTRSVETALLKMTQECLLNTQRHSKSSKAQMRIEIDSNQLTLDMRDDGIGTQPAKSNPADGSQPRLGVGLAGMAERMKELGGHLEITSGSWGTSVRATLPLVLSKLESEG